MNTDNNTVMFYDSYIPSNWLYINRTVCAQGVLLTSDARLKTDVRKLTGSLARLQQLEGITYRLLEKTPAKEGGDLTESSGIPVTDREQCGFLAQELEKVFPNLVETDTAGYKSIDYIGLIPEIVEALKEQQALINAQSLKIAELQSAQGEAILMPETVTQSRMAVQNDAKLAVEETAAVNAFLYQNAPNPFNTVTTIRYFLPFEAANASLYIFDMQGKLIESYPLGQAGEGSVEISASGLLQPGMYLYSLLVNNREVDTKRMVITE